MMRTDARTPAADALDHALTALYQQDADAAQPVPEAFATGWRAAVRREEQLQMQKQTKKKGSRFWKLALPVAAALVLVIGALCTNPPSPATNAAMGVARDVASYKADANDGQPSLSASESMSAEYDAASDTAMAAMADSGVSGSAGTSANANGSGVLPAGAKLVRTADLTLATAEFDAAWQKLQDQVTAVGGYVEYSYIRGDVGDGETRTGSLTLRIPSARLDEFLGFAGGLARVTYQSQSATDLTTQYSDTAMRLQTQQAKLERLQAMMAEATDMSDLIDIESAIADTQYMIDMYQSQLNGIDSQVDLSQVELTLREESVASVAKTTEISLGDRISSGFAASMKWLGRFFQNMLVFVVMASPVLIGLAALGLIAWLIVRSKRRRADREAQAPDAASGESADSAPDRADR